MIDRLAMHGSGKAFNFNRRREIGNWKFDVFYANLQYDCALFDKHKLVWDLHGKIY